MCGLVQIVCCTSCSCCACWLHAFHARELASSWGIVGYVGPVQTEAPCGVLLQPPLCFAVSVCVFQRLWYL
jgi:hypothetical protein